MLCQSLRRGLKATPRQPQGSRRAWGAPQGPGGGHTSRPEQSAGLPPPRPRRLRPLTARSSPRSAPALRPPPPCWRGPGGSTAPVRPHCSRTGGSRPASPPAAPVRPRPDAALKRPRSPRAPRAPGARRIPYIATASAKNRAPRQAAGRRRDPAAPARTRAPGTRGRRSPRPPAPTPAAGSEGARGAAFPATPRPYPVRPAAPRGWL